MLPIFRDWFESGCVALFCNLQGKKLCSSAAFMWDGSFFSFFLKRIILLDFWWKLFLTFYSKKYIYSYVYTHTHSHTYTHIYIQIHVYIYSYTYTYTFQYESDLVHLVHLSLVYYNLYKYEQIIRDLLQNSLHHPKRTIASQTPIPHGITRKLEVFW